MVQAFLLSVAQLGDRRIVGVFVESLALTLTLLIALGIGAYHGLAALAARLDWGAWARDIAGLIAVVLTILATGILFRAVAVLVIGLFADDVVEAVEAKHYPHEMAAARRVTLARSITMGLGSTARFVGVNLLLLPVYVLLLVTGIGPAILFFVVNGWLLGRDLGDMVAARHIAADDLKGWRGATAISRFALGLIGTGLFVVPVVNLAAPVIVAAMATHWFHRRGRR